MKTSVLRLIFSALCLSIGNVSAQSALQSLTHRYSFTSNADDSIGTANGTLQGGAVVANGALVLDGVDSFVNLPNNILAGYNSASIEVWLSDNGSGTWSRVWDFGNSTAGEDAAGTGNAYMFLTLQSGAGTVRSAFTPGTSSSEQIVEWNGHPALGQLAHIVVTVNGTTHTAFLYVNGVLVGSNDSFTLTPDSVGATLNDWIGRSQFGGDPFFNGAIDEFRIYNDALSPSDVLADYQAGPDKILTGPAYFVREPSSQSVKAGQTVTFDADVGGTPPISVLWYQNNLPMPGETNLTLSFSAVAGENGFTYQLRATNTYNGNDYFVISSNATLSVEADNIPPSLVRAQSYSTNGVDVFFSEILRADTATNVANYTLTGPDGSVPVTSATLDSSGSIVTLATAPLQVGSNYVLSVSGVRDFSGNLIAPGSSTNFIATIYVLRDIGFPETTGTISGATNGIVLSGGGSGISGASDQFTFGFQSRTGDFDVQVRLGALGLSDAWATAGLMARDTLATNAAFAASFATPGPAGCFFETRANSGAIAAQAGFFPVNYPDTWLRLKRSGNVFTGYASLDGKTWIQLGSATLGLSSTVELGIALSSHNAAKNTSAIISNNGETESATVANAPLPFEPIGPSSRRTGLVISEIMFHPKSAAGFGSLEFVEIYNSDLTFEDLSNYKLGGDIDYTFPPGTILPSGGYLVIARDPASVESFYGISGVLGPISGNLPNDNGTVRLINELGSVLLEVEYDSISPWPVSPDGAGHSLVLARPSYGENNAHAWAASDAIGGSPGRGDSFGAEPLRGMVINEILAHTDLPDLDSIELFNSTAHPLNLAGCVITDDPDVDRFTFGSVTIPARGFVYVTENDLGFRLNAAGETIFLKNPDGTRVLDAVRLEAQENGVSFGRYPDGNSEWYRLNAKTFGSANAAPRVSDVGINELMYHPISGSDDDQYVELYNHGTNAVDLGGWSFVSGIKFTFPTNTIISAGGYIVVAADKDRLMSNYSNLNSANTVGNFSGHLSHSGERVALAIPDTIASTSGGVTVTNLIAIPVDEVTYKDGGRWGKWSDGGGSSLELTDSRANKRLAANWADSDETAKAPWTLIERTDAAVLGMGDGVSGNGVPNRFEFFLQGAGECLVDDVEVRANDGANRVSNPGFESGTFGWAFQGTHAQTSLENSLAAFSGTSSLHVRATGRGDTGANRIRIGITAMPVNGTNQATLRARVRWLRGDPDILMRLRGNWLECAGVMTVPKNLGTPGAPNSRSVANAGPAIYDVKPFPILPAANEPVVVSARVDDPDGIANVTLRYRIDPTTTTVNIAMRDDGSGGDAFANDGIYSATIPGQSSGAMVAFSVQAQDSHSPSAGAQFPSDAPARECLIHFGETLRPGAVGSYRFWLTQSNLSYWASREKNSNEGLDATFVYGNWRVIYNAQALYSGSPWHTPVYTGPLGYVCNYSLEVPSDDLLLGSEEFDLEGQDFTESSTFNNDASAQAENTAQWMGRKIGVRPDYRRHVVVYMNGQQRGMVYYDYQQPNGELLEEYYPDDSDGHLYKIEDWFEFDDGGGNQNAITARMLENNFNGQKRTERYRWNFRPRATDMPNDFAEFYALVDAVNAPAPEPYTGATLNVANIREWMRMFALEHMAGNWDSYGYERGKNMFIYKPENGPWELLLWDIQLVLGKSSRSPSDPIFNMASLTDPVGGGDPTIFRMFNHPPFAREFWEAMKELVNGPMLPENYGPLMDARVSALRENAIPVQDPTSVKSWIAARRVFIASQIPQADFSVNGATAFTSSSNAVALTGSAPIGVSQILVNGIAYPLTWTGVTSWSLRIPLISGINTLNLTALDGNGNVITNGTATITVNYTGTAATPAGNIVLNEIMNDPARPENDFVELLNTHSTDTFDLSGWRVDGLNYIFPAGSILAPGNFLVLAKNKYDFATAFGGTNVVFDQFDQPMNSGGGTLTIVKPGAPDEIVDRVRYENSPPWPGATNGESLQLVDAKQDNSRVANWAVSEGSPAITQNLITMTNIWKYNQFGDQGVSWRAADFNDASWNSGRALLYVESAAMPAPKNTPLTLGKTTYYFRTTFNFDGNPAGATLQISTVIDDGAVFYLNGQEVYRLGMPSGAISYSTFASRTIGNATLEGPFTIPATNLVRGTNVLAVEVHQISSGSSDIVFGMTLDGVSGGTMANTPGAPNSVTANLPPFPPIWLNEAQSENTSGPLDNFNQHDPWIELYNSGSSDFSLNGYYLTGDYGNLTNWAFPANASIPANGFLVVWCDNETNQSALNVPHANFRLAQDAGNIALARIVNGAPQIVDYLNYSGVPPNASYGDFPDGQPFFRKPMIATPGATNSDAVLPVTVFINEWMADNSKTLADPADGDFEDWFELYNPSANPADLGGYYLTDSLNNKTKFQVPNNGQYIVPAHGFLIVWADGEPEQNTASAPDLHAGFSLSKGGEAIGLFARDGSQIDAVTFGAQTTDVSEGHFPDATGPVYPMNFSTPGAANLLDNTSAPPQFGSVSVTNGTVSLSFNIMPGKKYHVEYTDNLASRIWISLGTDVTATNSPVLIQESIGTNQHRFYRVVQREN